MKIKNTMSYHFTPARWLSPITQQTTSAGGDVEKGETFCTVGGMQTGVATMESITKFPKKTKNGTSL